MKLRTKQQTIVMILVMILLLLVGSIIVEAALKDTAADAAKKTGDFFKKSFGDIKKIKPYVTKFRLVSYAVATIVLIGLALVFVSSVKDASSKWPYLLLCVALAVVITISMVGPDKYIWSHETVESARSATIGPKTADCEDSAKGIYKNLQTGECDRQAVLRTNGVFGLPALIVGFIVILVLLRMKVVSEQFGLEDSGKIQLIVAAILAFSISNGHTSYESILNMGQYILMFVFYYTFKESMGSGGGWRGNDETSTTVPVALAYGVVASIADIISTLFSTDTFGTSTIMKNLLFGLVIGVIHNGIWGEKGAMKRYFDKRAEKHDKELDEMAEKGEWFNMFVRSLPIIGTFSKMMEARAKRKKELALGKWKEVAMLNEHDKKIMAKADADLKQINEGLTMEKLLVGQKIPADEAGFKAVIARRLGELKIEADPDQVVRILKDAWQAQLNEDAAMKQAAEEVKQSLDADTDENRQLESGFGDEDVFDIPSEFGEPEPTIIRP